MILRNFEPRASRVRSSRQASGGRAFPEVCQGVSCRFGILHPQNPQAAA